MRTTISIPQELFAAVQRLTPQQPFSQFARNAIREKVAHLQREKLAAEMEKGYRAEAEDSSLEREWKAVETDGL